jgi:hypothetical protein
VGMAGSSRGKWRRDQLSHVGRKGNNLMGEAHESAVGERSGELVKCATPRRKRNPAITPRRFGPTRPTKEAATYTGRAG